MRVNQLAQAVAVTPDTVRFYTRVGYLAPIKNPSNGYKEYDDNNVRRLRFILSARQLGFSVEDIGKILNESDQGMSPCPTVRQLIELRLQDHEQRFNDMLKLRQRMLAAVEQWSDKDNKLPTGKMICHLIEEFTHED